MAEDEIIKHTKAAYKVYKDPEKNWKHKLKDILLEVLIIVFAVSLSIWLHNWSDGLKDKRDEKEFLTGLKGDIQADLKEMQSDRTNLRKELAGMRYFSEVGAGRALNADSLSKYVWVFFSEAQINPRIGRFEALKSSGKLDIIENKKLQYKVIDLYQKNFPQIFRVNQSNNHLVTDKIAPFIGDNLELDGKGSPVNAQNVLRKSKMRILLMQANGVTNSINAYTDGIETSTEIIKKIDEELK